MPRQSFRRAKAISIRPRVLESLRLGVAGRFRPLRAGMGTRTPRAFGSSRSQSALASALGPVADTGSIALVAGRPLGGQHLGQEHQRASGVAHRARREEEGEWPAPSVAHPMQPGGRAALRAPDRARAAPPFLRLAAVRWAFRCVLSLIRVSPSAPGLARLRTMRANTPGRDHRAERL